MVSVRKRKMNRSGVAKVRTRSRKNNKEQYNPRSNPVIAKHWDKELTPSQNYKKLGLTFKLAAKSGGEEKKIKINPIQHNNMEESLYGSDDEDMEKDQEELDPYDPANILEGTAKMRRDEDGNVVEIIYGTKKIKSKKDAVEEAESSEEEDNSKAKEVIAELEELANLQKKKEFHRLNELEVHRCKKLIEKYGEDYEKMKWDKRLNPFQLSPAQLRKLIEKYHQQLEIEQQKQQAADEEDEKDDEDDEEN